MFPNPLVAYMMGGPLIVIVIVWRMLRAAVAVLIEAGRDVVEVWRMQNRLVKFNREMRHAFEVTR